MYIDIFSLFKNSWKMILLGTVLFASVGFFIATVMPARFESNLSMIIIQKHDAEKIDAFSAARSAEYLGGILTRVVYTNTFMNDVMQSPDVIDTLPKTDMEKRLDVWKKSVSAKKINNTGIIDIRVLDTSRSQAENIAKAIIWNFQNNGQSYHGGGDSVELRLIDGPVTSVRPTTPNIPLSVIFSALIGGMVSLAFVVLNASNVLQSNRSEIDPVAQAIRENGLRIN